jgi:hypothetical protein
MRSARRLVGAAVILGLLSAPARADVFDFIINGGAGFNITSGSPVSFNFAGTPAISQIYGFTLAGDWTDVSGGPWSSDLLVNITPAGLSATGARNVGGVDNGDPFTFPGGSFGFFGFNGQTSNAAYAWHGGANASAGTWSIAFDTSWGGSTANLANAVITVYSSPSFNFSGTNATGDTFDRPEQDGSGLSGEIVQYNAQSFVASVSGRHLFAADYNYDGFLALYEGTFNPANPMANLIGAADDDFFVGTAASTFSAVLTEGQTYILVHTSFDATENGNFSSFVLGPAAIPEPATLALLGLALGSASVGYRWMRSKRRLESPLPKYEQV